ncbi:MULTISPECIES: hypothetical protein [unclassified Granulicatella]|uniref:hypothetical protein n=1 Tax=unclassified Granulicatella TaxID=2630493 RepID=UPI0010745430|nr:MULTISPECIES: hypothetical protein [unclassified Granulicatella]MBF0779566.1 hypothetical protein [Granulicatella sp. 19428wC4_WM01]TFU96370.1 hypothetical protein E4T68_00515 [Granulicatella sp. WM01]
MDINQSFQDILARENFVLKQTEEDTQWVYQGKLMASEYHVIDFAVSLTKGEQKGVCQIVFHNLACCQKFEDREKWLQFINNWNVTQGIYYYLCLGLDGRIFLRYVSEVHGQMQVVYDTLQTGSSLVKKLLVDLSNQFGATVIF